MRTFLLLVVACREETTPPTDTAGDTPPVTSTLPVPPTFDLWVCPEALAEPRDAWVLRDVYVDAREQLSSIDALVEGNLDPDQHTNCPTSGNEVSCLQGAYDSPTGVSVTFREVVSEVHDAQTVTEMRVVNAVLHAAAWQLDWESGWTQTSGPTAPTGTDETWSLSWLGEPLPSLPADTSLEATSFVSEGGDFDVNAATWAWEDCAWSVLDQRHRTSEGSLYEIGVLDTALTIALEGDRWLAYLDGTCVGEVDSVTWAVTGDC